MPSLNIKNITTSNGYIDTLALSTLIKNSKDENERIDLITSSIRCAQDLMSSKDKTNEKEIKHLDKEINEIKLGIEKIRSDIAKTNSNLTLEIETLRNEMNIKISDVNLKISETKSSLIKWIAGLMAGNIAILASIIFIANQ
jgi:hypothetical protein